MTATSSVKTIIQTENAPAAIGTYSQAVKTGNLLFVSGQIPLNPANGEMVSEDFTEQAHQVFKNLIAVAEAAGTSLDNAVKLGVFLTDLGNFAALNDVMAQYVKAPFPARAAVEISALPKAALIEIDAIIAIEE
ncbi:MAG TPA: reactive intermediate/imine deaminase [Gammaproteobacteria bacterium]|nr:reactive intermediate/imine deaminase [Gammaproteobacteria bacterium]MEC8010624.1 Rid family detoxifying hydrolase [Pseudomonadota bacterium]HBF07435.1 reactive intermediate/imine deaminase [Gammaproteobacteria bacterium]HCK93152.1 reactive intermediate/imine deaminase [Gammaproteobacteria bacterium]|tara:strand:- start:935 stop:1336 length:402 start_codon:yes stop_codon:yes gene_type:complete